MYSVFWMIFIFTKHNFSLLDVSNTPKSNRRSLVMNSPGTTPKKVLRDKNKKLMEMINEKENILKESEKENEELREFQKQEISFLEESFNRKASLSTIVVSLVYHFWKKYSNIC